MIAPYPLQWPDGIDRTPPAKRLKSPFRTGFDQAVKKVAGSLRLFQKEAGVKIEHVVLSSNVTLLDKRPVVPGAVAWFLMDGQWVAFGVDRFSAFDANIIAIHHLIEARRVELRYGRLAIVRQTFRAFLALPAPGRKPRWEVLNTRTGASVELIETRFRILAAHNHPDKRVRRCDGGAQRCAGRSAQSKREGLILMTPDQIRALRTRLGWTRRQLAERLMLSPLTVEGLERGEHRPSLRVKRILAMIEREAERSKKGEGL